VSAAAQRPNSQLSGLFADIPNTAASKRALNSLPYTPQQLAVLEHKTWPLSTPARNSQNTHTKRKGKQKNQWSYLDTGLLHALLLGLQHITAVTATCSVLLHSLFHLFVGQNAIPKLLTTRRHPRQQHIALASCSRLRRQHTLLCGFKVRFTDGTSKTRVFALHYPLKDHLFGEPGHGGLVIRHVEGLKQPLADSDERCFSFFFFLFLFTLIWTSQFRWMAKKRL
jgi:hypothetical protein